MYDMQHCIHRLLHYVIMDRIIEEKILFGMTTIQAIQALRINHNVMAQTWNVYKVGVILARFKSWVVKYRRVA